VLIFRGLCDVEWANG